MVRRLQRRQKKKEKYFKAPCGLIWLYLIQLSVNPVMRVSVLTRKRLERPLYTAQSTAAGAKTARLYTAPLFVRHPTKEKKRVYASTNNWHMFSHLPERWRHLGHRQLRAAPKQSAIAFTHCWLHDATLNHAKRH